LKSWVGPRLGRVAMGSLAVDSPGSSVVIGRGNSRTINSRNHAANDWRDVMIIILHIRPVRSASSQASRRRRRPLLSDSFCGHLHISSIVLKGLMPHITYQCGLSSTMVILTTESWLSAIWAYLKILGASRSWLGIGRCLAVLWKGYLN